MFAVWYADMKVWSECDVAWAELACWTWLEVEGDDYDAGSDCSVCAVDCDSGVVIVVTGVCDYDVSDVTSVSDCDWSVSA